MFANDIRHNVLRQHRRVKCADTMGPGLQIQTTRAKTVATAVAQQACVVMSAVTQLTKMNGEEIRIAAAAAAAPTNFALRFV